MGVCGLDYTELGFHIETLLVNVAVFIYPYHFHLTQGILNSAYIG